ncbi:AAA family ATPase [Patulibacter americanus]|uniref:AAA family ATPase n=1 Tax=Patulibacter americanus TaxID=588672 RepID=UPI0003B6DE74|nr:LuxR family transcriptional regulator [Patulibacter americanus]
MLLARDREMGLLAGVLDRARGGQGQALVVRGAAGVGKTALLRWTLDRASGFRVLRATGAEFEMDLAYAGLHALCAPLLDRRDRLPWPQRDALEAAFGLASGATADPLMIGMALLALLSDVADEIPVLCVIDDAQWLDRDSAQAVAFAARRIGSDRAAVVFGVREPHVPAQLQALPALEVTGLPDEDARALLSSLFHAPMDERVVDRVVAEARGNPLVLRELAAGDVSARFDGGFVVAPREQPAQALFRARADGLPDATRRLLLLAAAEPLGDPALLWRAAEQLGVTVDDAAPAEGSGLLTLGEKVEFPHPLARSAIYQAAPAADRRDAHAALAAATDATTDPDRRIWHRAQATTGHDETVAAQLVRSAERARGRGGTAAAAAFLERAAALTPDATMRGERALEAAAAKLEAGAPDDAGRLVGSIDRAGVPDLLGARADMLLGLIAFGQRRGGDAPALLRRAARQLAPLDPVAAREAHIDAVLAGVAAGPLGEGLDEVAATALDAPPAAVPPTALDALLDGLALWLTGRYAEGGLLLGRALADPDGAVWTGRPTLACLVAIELCDLDAYESILTDQVARLRATGALTFLPHALSPLAGALLHRGRFRDAETLLAESDVLADAIGIARLRYQNMHVAALRGDAERTRSLVDASLRDAEGRGEGFLCAFAHYATAVLLNGRSDPAGALVAAERAATPLDFSLEGMRVRELVEAAVRAGEPDRGRSAFAGLAERTRVLDTPWARGTESVCGALLADRAGAEALFAGALEQFERGGMPTELGRAELLYGEWLRRSARRAEARVQLRRAFDRLTAIGAAGFAERARRELLATGERARSRTPDAVDDLTPQERHIARLVATGATSKEVAAELFLSPRTIDAHLRGVFRKLDITSRRQLRGHPLLATDEPGTAPVPA